MDSTGLKIEHGAEDPRGAQTAAAPATVSGSPSVLPAARPEPLGNREGRRKARIRKPGDLPSLSNSIARRGVRAEVAMCFISHFELSVMPSVRNPSKSGGPWRSPLSKAKPSLLTHDYRHSTTVWPPARLNEVSTI